MKESSFQAHLVKELKDRFPECIILKNDPTYIQGVPDLIVLNGKKWAALECKRTSKSSHRPNQDYYVDKMNNMSYATFVSPENEEDVLNDLERSFKGSTRRKSRVPRSV